MTGRLPARTRTISSTPPIARAPSAPHGSEEYPERGLPRPEREPQAELGEMASLEVGVEEEAHLRPDRPSVEPAQAEAEVEGDRVVQVFVERVHVLDRRVQLDVPVGGQG